jgi:hypothetical protein
LIFAAQLFPNKYVEAGKLSGANAKCTFLSRTIFACTINPSALIEVWAMQ